MGGYLLKSALEYALGPFFFLFCPLIGTLFYPLFSQCQCTQQGHSTGGRQRSPGAHNYHLHAEILCEISEEYHRG